MKNTTLAVLLVITSVAWSLGAAAQGPRPSFEVASVKPNKSGTNFVSIEGRPGGGMVFTNIPLRGIITFAYELQDFQLVDAPDWIANERFDINAKASIDAPAMVAPVMQNAQTRLMMQSLLEERFKLTAHRDKRPLPIYNLVLARADGKPGPQLKPSTVDCNADRSGGRGPGRGAPPELAVPGDRPACGMMMSPGRVAAGGTPMSRLISPLSMFTRRIVVDKTGLNGNFDIDLVWTPDQMPSGPPPPGVTLPAIDPNGPSIFTALQEQLGLKLESQTGPVDVLVIDGVERPTPD